MSIQQTHHKVLAQTETNLKKNTPHGKNYPTYRHDMKQKSIKSHTGMEAMPKNILTMRNYVGGEATFSVMNTSHPDGPSAASD